MEESITVEHLRSYMMEQFGLEEVDIRTYSPLVLAYIGDSVYDLLIKSIIIKKGNMQVNKMHQQTAALVKAQTQSKMIGRLEKELTDEEMSVFRRGRNAKSATTAKNATVMDYRRATGFETLIGYLLLKKEYTRIMDLVKIGLEEEKGI